MESPRDEFDRSWQPRLWITGRPAHPDRRLPDRVRRRQRQGGFGRLRLRPGAHLVDLGDPALAPRRARRRRAALAAVPAPSGAQERGERRDALADLRRRRVAERQPRRAAPAPVGEEVGALDEGDAGGLGAREQVCRVDRQVDPEEVAALRLAPRRLTGELAAGAPRASRRAAPSAGRGSAPGSARRRRGRSTRGRSPASGTAVRCSSRRRAPRSGRPALPAPRTSRPARPAPRSSRTRRRT